MNHIMIASGVLRTLEPTVEEWLNSIPGLLRARTGWQLDVKSLEDIPSIYPQVAGKIFPRYQYSLKDVVTTTTQR